jgi:hypothetical protein
MALPSRNPSSSIPCYNDVPDTNVRRRDGRFISQVDVDAWVRDRRAVVQGSVLTVASSGERYVLRDAVRVLAPRDRSVDVFGMTGRVVAVSELLNMGSTLSSWSLRVGTSDYDVQIGFMVQALERVEPFAAGQA